MSLKQRIHVALNLMQILFSLIAFGWVFFIGNRDVAHTDVGSIISLIILVSLFINSVSNVYFVRNGIELEQGNASIIIVRFIICFFATLSTVALFLISFLMSATVLFSSYPNEDGRAVFLLCIVIGFALFSLIVMINSINFRNEQKIILAKKESNLVKSIGTTEHE